MSEPLIVLVHSPLLGPMSWDLVAARLRRAGHGVLVPSLRSALSGRPPLVDACVRAVARDVEATEHPGPLVLIGHSGAGVLLPAMAGLLGPRDVRFVFVDATVPPDHGDTVAADGWFLEFLTGLPHREGRLPRWSEWWGDDVMDTLIPDPNLREHVIAELPRVPLAYFSEAIHVPSGWSDRPAAYLQLSEVYSQEVAWAEQRGWTVARVDGHHLFMLDDPGRVAAELGSLL